MYNQTNDWEIPQYNFGPMTSALGNTQPMGPGLPAPAPLASALTDPSGYGALTGVSRESMGLPAAAGAAGVGGIGGRSGIGLTGMDKIGIGLRGLETLAGLYMGLKQLSLAKKQFKFTKEVTNTNLNNSIKSYNTALADRARSRGFTEGQSQGQIDQYTNSNKLSRG